MSASRSQSASIFGSEAQNFRTGEQSRNHGQLTSTMVNTKSPAATTTLDAAMREMLGNLETRRLNKLLEDEVGEETRLTLKQLLRIIYKSQATSGSQTAPAALSAENIGRLWFSLLDGTRVTDTVARSKVPGDAARLAVQAGTRVTDTVAMSKVLAFLQHYARNTSNTVPDNPSGTPEHGRAHGITGSSKKRKTKEGVPTSKTLLVQFASPQPKAVSEQRLEDGVQAHQGSGALPTDITSWQRGNVGDSFWSRIEGDTRNRRVAMQAQAGGRLSENASKNMDASHRSMKTFESLQTGSKVEQVFAGGWQSNFFTSRATHLHQPHGDRQLQLQIAELEVVKAATTLIDNRLAACPYFGVELTVCDFNAGSQQHAEGATGAPADSQSRSMRASAHDGHVGTAIVQSLCEMLGLADRDGEHGQRLGKLTEMVQRRSKNQSIASDERVADSVQESVGHVTGGFKNDKRNGVYGRIQKMMRDFDARHARLQSSMQSPDTTPPRAAETLDQTWDVESDANERMHIHNNMRSAADVTSVAATSLHYDPASSLADTNPVCQDTRSGQDGGRNCREGQNMAKDDIAGSDETVLVNTGYTEDLRGDEGLSEADVRETDPDCERGRAFSEMFSQWEAEHDLTPLMQASTSEVELCDGEHVQIDAGASSGEAPTTASILQEECPQLEGSVVVVENTHLNDQGERNRLIHSSASSSHSGSHSDTSMHHCQSGTRDSSRAVAHRIVHDTDSEDGIPASSTLPHSSCFDYDSDSDHCAQGPTSVSARLVVLKRKAERGRIKADVRIGKKPQRHSAHGSIFENKLIRSMGGEERQSKTGTRCGWSGCKGCLWCLKSDMGRSDCRFLSVSDCLLYSSKQSRKDPAVGRRPQVPVSSESVDDKLMERAIALVREADAAGAVTASTHKKTGTCVKSTSRNGSGKRERFVLGNLENQPRPDRPPSEITELSSQLREMFQEKRANSHRPIQNSSIAHRMHEWQSDSSSEDNLCHSKSDQLCKQAAPSCKTQKTGSDGARWRPGPVLARTAWLRGKESKRSESGKSRDLEPLAITSPASAQSTTTCDAWTRQPRSLAESLKQARGLPAFRDEHTGVELAVRRWTEGLVRR